MRVAVTGTPGTGKTTATEVLKTELDVVHLNEVVHEEGLATGHDEERDTLVADIEALQEHLAGRDELVVESHLAHHLAADRVVVLRCHPEKLADRLRDRGEPDAKVTENAESEALDVILSEAVARHGDDSVYEIDTTEMGPDEVAEAIGRVISGAREPSAGTVSFIEYL